MTVLLLTPPMRTATNVGRWLMTFGSDLLEANAHAQLRMAAAI